MTRFKLKHLAISAAGFLIVGASVAAAQTASPSGSIRNAIQDKVNQELAQIKQGVAKKGFVGSITTKSDSTITITNLKNQPRTATVTTDTTIKLAGNKDGTPKDLKVGDFILAMGDVDSENKMTAKRLLVVVEPEDDTRKVLMGSVTSATSSNFQLTSPSGTATTVKFTSATKYNDGFKATNLKTGAKLVVITKADSALKVFILSPAPSPTPKQ